jgi:hypothetical protein
VGGEFEVAVVVPEVGTLEALAQALLDDQRVGTPVGDDLVEGGHEVLGDGVGVDDDVVACLYVDGVVTDRLGVFANARVHVRVVG